MRIKSEIDIFLSLLLFARLFHVHEVNIGPVEVVAMGPLCSQGLDCL